MLPRATEHQCQWSWPHPCRRLSLMHSGKGKLKQHWKVAISKKKVKLATHGDGHPPLPCSFCTTVGLVWLFADGAAVRSFLGEPGEHLLHLWAAARAEPAVTSCSAHTRPWAGALTAFKRHQTPTMKIHFSKCYWHEHLVKHMINLSKMLFLLRQAEKNHKIWETTREVAQVDRTQWGPSYFIVPSLFCSHCQEPSLNAENTESGLLVRTRTTQVFRAPEDFCPQSLGCVLGLCFFFF